MRFCVLGSGSKGNCTLVEADGTRLLIDAGFSCKETVQRLAAVNIAPSSLAGILITHEHSDHVRGVSVFAKKFQTPIYATPATFAASFGETGSQIQHRPFFAGESFNLGGLEIHPFSVSHDAVDPVGFLMKTHAATFGYCTDTGIVSRLIRHRLSECNGLVLESNYDPEMLATGPYPPQLQQRVRSKTGHLANAEAGELLADILHAGLRQVVLAHLSEKNNHKELALTTVMEHLNQAIPQENRRSLPRITLAAQDQVGEYVNLA